MYQSLSFYRFAAIFSAVALLLLGVGFLQPFSFGDDASAESKDVDVSVTLEPTISISTDVDAVDIAVAASDYEALLTDSVTVSVGTNNTYGYTLTMSAEGSETALVNSSNSNIKIPTLTAETTSTTWAGSSDLNNKWGFTHDNTDLLPTGTYLPVVAANETNDTTIKETGEPSNSSDTAVTFATKVDASQLSGKYQNTVIFSAIANAEAPKTYMQDFTTEQCSALAQWTKDGTEGDTLTATDARDGKEYSIRRLADGHCWMVDNLAITDKNITSDDSDSAGNFTIPATSGGSSSISWTNDYANPYMHIGNSTDDGGNSWAEGYGPYYNWNLATAGQGVQATSTSVNYSICPKKWKLPLGDTSDYSWYYLYNTGYSASVANFQAATKTGTGYLGGDYSNGALFNAGSYGYWWSRTPLSSATNDAYSLLTSSSSVDPQSGSSKRLGFAIRCVFASS